MSYLTGRPTQDQVYSIAYPSKAEWNDTRFFREDFDKLIFTARGELDTAKARDVFSAMLDSQKSPDQIMSELGIAQVDESETINLCREILAANPAIVADYKAGKTKALGGLVGQAKKRNPNVNPARVQAICLDLLSKM